ncbi:biosynthetic arginine decarboxylase [Terasakiella pusilla]|uniref:biosynthetic arginine decarboxylase n=1 Tax=Terasakiella pusilla TaxID=64973 RepID=UPI000491B8D7|nr:biosynthetic arginine decarboxylase [Terasakiella pusilla]
MGKWTLNDAHSLYRVAQWSNDYFNISDCGNLVVQPYPTNKKFQIKIQDVVDELRQQNVSFPVVMRFHDILKDRVVKLNEAFDKAIKDHSYAGEYRGVYPIKVNQMREVVDEIVDAGMPFHYGLEAGSKTELMAVLSFKTSPQALTICNGYKDEALLRLALSGVKMGRKVFVVIEKYSEIPLLLKLAEEMNVRPLIGLRIKMRVTTEGRWSGSSGEKAKFGLTISELIQAIEYTEERGFADCIQLLHFHVGSQLSDSSYITSAVEEGTRVYARLKKRGVPIKYLDIGGGLAIDYDGSGTSRHSSMNYSLDEYAVHVVASVQQMCQLEKVSEPNLVTESGRAITAHHSCVIMQVQGEISPQGVARKIPEPAEDEHYLLSNLRELLDNARTQANSVEAKGQARTTFDDLLVGFKLGVVRLEEVATAENIYWEILRVLENCEQEEDTEDAMHNMLATQYLCNFSLFQSAADSWAIQQLLPVAPLTNLGTEPTKRCTLADITCDSDGKIDRFVAEMGERPTLLLHELEENKPYYIGLFLTGAYQDVMGDMHNLFGRLNEVHVFADEQDPNNFYVEEYVKGSSASKVLRIMQYNPESMASSVKKEVDQKVKEGVMKAREGVQLVDFYEKCLKSYTYLKA